MFADWFILLMYSVIFYLLSFPVLSHGDSKMGVEYWASVLTLSLLTARAAELAAQRAPSALPPRKFLVTDFSYTQSEPQSHSMRKKGSDQFKISKDPTGNRTRYLPSCSAVLHSSPRFLYLLFFFEIYFFAVFLVALLYTRWFKYDRDKLWLVYTQSVPVIFEPPCISVKKWKYIQVLVVVYLSCYWTFSSLSVFGVLFHPIVPEYGWYVLGWNLT
jgi:hypothetical protein